MVIWASGDKRRALAAAVAPAATPPIINIFPLLLFVLLI